MNYLIHEIRNGCEDCKTELICRVKPLILSMITRHNATEFFDDIYQDSVELLLQCVRQYDDRYHVPFIAYYQQQLHYYYLNRKKQARDPVSLDKEIMTDTGNVMTLKELLPSPQGDEWDKVIRQEERAVLEQAFKTLTEKQQWILIEYYYKGKTLKTLSQEQKIHPQSLSKLKTRALEKLKEKIGK